MENQGNLFNNDKGMISYNRSIITSIVALATEEIEGVASVYKKAKNKDKTGVKIDFEKDGVYIDVSIKMYSGYTVPDVAFKIQENIKRGVETMTDYKVKNINVSVLGVTFANEIIEK